MRCPDCKTDLIEDSREKVSVDCCPTCQGFWLDRGELNDLVDRQDHLVEFTSVDHDPGIHGDNHPSRKCPRCQHAMKKVDLLEEDSGIVYDYCPTCQGFWLDAGELARTKQYLKEKGKGLKSMQEALATLWSFAEPTSTIN